MADQFPHKGHLRAEASAEKMPERMILCSACFTWTQELAVVVKTNGIPWGR